MVHLGKGTFCAVISGPKSERWATPTPKVTRWESTRWRNQQQMLHRPLGSAPRPAPRLPSQCNAAAHACAGPSPSGGSGGRRDATCGRWSVASCSAGSVRCGAAHSAIGWRCTPRVAPHLMRSAELSLMCFLLLVSPISMGNLWLFFLSIVINNNAGTD